MLRIIQAGYVNSNYVRQKKALQSFTSSYQWNTRSSWQYGKINCCQHHQLLPNGLFGKVAKSIVANIINYYHMDYLSFGNNPL